MITRCPQCRAWFRVRAEHLSVANGYVTCGDCDAVFNALQTLVDESAPPVVAPGASGSGVPPDLPPDTPAPVDTPPPREPGLSGDPLPANESAPGAVPAEAAKTHTASVGSPAPDVVAPAEEASATAETGAEAVVPSPGPPPAERPPPLVSRDSATQGASATPDMTHQGVSGPGPDARAATDTPGSPNAPPDGSPAAVPGSPVTPAAGVQTPGRDANLPEPRDDLAAVAVPTIREEHGPLPGSDPEPVSTTAGPTSPDGRPGTPAMPDAPVDDLFAAEFDDALEPEAATETPELPLADAHETDATVAEPVSTGHTLSEDEHAILFTEPGVEDDDEDVEDTVPEYDPDKAPAVLQSDIAQLAAGRRTPLGAVWGLVVLALLIAALAQVAWIQREPLGRVLPAAQPVVETLCRALDCDAGAVAGTDAIRLLARDVREHPQYRDALLVNATLVNTAATPRPYPVIELSLHDAVGSVLGARRFAPGEYLDESIAIEDGMPPDRPVYVVLELGADALAAISFEFTFL